MSLSEQLGLTHRIVQAGMGGGIAGAPLAGAVSAAGALGTVGTMPPALFAASLKDAQRRAGVGRPVAANLLIPFTKRAHLDACIEARVPVVVLHAGRSPTLIQELRAAGIDVLHTVGTAEAAREALSDGATGLVAQGLEAGGHTVATVPAMDALTSILEVADAAPVWAAGGVAEAADVQRLLNAGADAVVAGTRFVMTHESGVHPGYKRALASAEETMLTDLFGFGWPMRHRVLVNGAVRRWGQGPALVRALNARTARIGAALPLNLIAPTSRLQSKWIPIYTPGVPLPGMPDRMLETTALYAGESVARMCDIISAADAVAALARTSG